MGLIRYIQIDVVNFLFQLVSSLELDIVWYVAQEGGRVSLVHAYSGMLVLRLLILCVFVVVVPSVKKSPAFYDDV
jgi:hypothetical protein